MRRAYYICTNEKCLGITVIIERDDTDKEPICPKCRYCEGSAIELFLVKRWTLGQFRATMKVEHYATSNKDMAISDTGLTHPILDTEERYMTDGVIHYSLTPKPIRDKYDR